MIPLPLLLAASLVGNAVLLAALFAFSPSAATGSSTAKNATDARRPADSVSTAASPTLWKNISASDLTAQKARLIAANFPPDIVRAILLAQIQDNFAARRKGLNPVTNPTKEFWKNSQTTDPKIVNELRALNREQRKAINDLLGPDPQAIPLQGALDDGRTGLPPGKANLVASIKRDYSEMRDGIFADAIGGVPLPDDRTQLALLEKEQRADIVRALTPDELLTYDLQTSNTASTMRSQLIGFNPTEAEFRAIFEKRHAFDERYDGSSLVGQFTAGPTAPPTQDELRQRADAQKQLTSDITAMLGPERGAEYQRSLDGSYQMISRVVDRLGLPTTTAMDAWTLQKDIQQRAQAVQTNRQLAPEDRNAQLTALSAEAAAKLTATLGPRGFDVYKNYGGQWVQNLQPRPATGPAGARGGGTTTITGSRVGP